MKKIEVLFPEITSLFGDHFNYKYLAMCSDEIEIVTTSLKETPKFLNEDISLVYMGPMCEKSQELVIDALKPYVSKINEKINNNQLFLIIGNALEVFGQYIENEDGSRIEGLAVTNLYAKRDMMHRYNNWFLGSLDDMEIVGFMCEFAMSYGDNSNNYLFKVNKGIGINKESKFEGYRKNNFMCSYLLGPLLVSNPDFTKYILKLMGIKEPSIKFEESIVEAYKIRLKEFKELNF